MRLAWKLTLVLGVGICAVQGVCAWSRVERESALFEAEMRRDHRVLGKAVAVTAANVWVTSGESRALDLIDDANVKHSHVLIEWVSQDGLLASGDPVAGVLLGDVGGAAEPNWVREGVDGERYLHSLVPVIVAGDVVGAVHLSESLAPEGRYIRTTMVRVLAGTLATVAVTAAMTLALGYLFVGRPVRRLVELARRIGEGDFSGRLHLGHHDEIGTLAGEIDGMCDRLAAARNRIAAETSSRLAAVEQLRHAERLATAGTLVSGVAHELGTPLAVAGLRAKAIAAGETPGNGAADNARVIVEQLERITRIIRQLLDFARRRNPQKSSTDLGRVVQSTLSLLAPVASKRQVVLSRIGEDVAAHALVDPGQIQQVLTNLVVNAIQSMPSGGQVSVAVRRERARPPVDAGGPPADFVRLDVRDQGSGIPAAILPRIFDPFFTTKEVGEGTGLGLSVSHGIVQEHGGWIAVESAEGRGTCFSVFLPCGSGAEAES